MGNIFYLQSNNNEGTSFLATGIEDEFVLNSPERNTLEKLQEWIDKKQDWIFGCISYDFKNNLENLQSHNVDPQGFPLLHFVRPLHVGRIQNGITEILKGDAPAIAEFQKRFTAKHERNFSPVILTPKISKEQYIDAIRKIKKHIQHGDIYEINFCQEFFAETLLDSPYEVWQKLNERTRAPFSAFVKLNEHHLLCASPERFLQKKGNRILSQPIKGTIRRGMNEHDDILQKNKLATSQKDKSENVMIVDLVRNDLSKHATRGSVRVDELFGIHTFNTVHHMVSTISAELKPGVPFTDILRDTFPMGSMTGAPKIRAMQLIDEFESTARGLYSGSVGYIEPNGDFDFNVVIRSIMYNEKRKYISCMTGGAITAMSDPEEEYEESLLKAEALLNILANHATPRV